VAQYFHLSEFTCKDGCGLNNAHPDLVDMLDEARDIAQIPFLITSGSRCRRHNKLAGGTRTSSHLAGLAADIAAIHNHTRWLLVESLLMAGFTRIGIAKTFIHVDIDDSKPPNTIWLY